VSGFLVGLPVAVAIGAPISTGLLGLDGLFGSYRSARSLSGKGRRFLDKRRMALRLYNQTNPNRHSPMIAAVTSMTTIGIMSTTTSIGIGSCGGLGGPRQGCAFEHLARNEPTKLALIARGLLPADETERPRTGGLGAALADRPSRGAEAGRNRPAGGIKHRPLRSATGKRP
jgi:hypothetical protein